MNKIIVSIAATAVLVASLAGCSQSATSASFVAGSALVIGESAPLVSANSGIAVASASQIGGNDLAQLTMPAFYSPDASGKLAANTAFGTVKYSGSKVTFSLAGKAKWSDGEPVSPADLVLSWLAATSPSDSGFSSQLSATSLAQTSNPVISNNSLSLTLKAPVPNWQTMLPITVPAHIIGQAAFGLNTPAAADARILAAAAGSHPGDVAKLGAAYAAVGVEQKITAGAYSVVSESSSSAKLKANPNFAFGPKPTVANLTINFYNSTDNLVSAIVSKKVDLASPVETISQTYPQLLSAAKASGLNYTAGDSGNNEVMLLNQAPSSSFSVQGAGGPKKSAIAQSAFFLFAPRAGIYSSLLPGSALKRTDSLVFGSADTNYSAATAQNGLANFKFQNGEASYELWATGGFSRTIPVRVLFDSNNPRAQLEYSQLAQWDKTSGFTIENVSSANPASVLATGQWDLYLTDQGRLGTNLDALATASGAVTGFSVAAVNTIVAKIASQASFAQSDVELKNLDQLLIQNHYGLPLFELPGIEVYSKKLAGFASNSPTVQVTWGYSNWSVSASGK